MMMNLNSRMVYNTTNDSGTVTNDELSIDYRRPVISTTQGGISVTRTREEWTDEESSSRGLGQPKGDKGLMLAGNHPLDSNTNAA